MKSFWLLFSLGMLTLCYYSCEKETPKITSFPNEVNKYFEPVNSDFVPKDFPKASANGPVIDNITGNSSVIEGGSNLISIVTDDTIDKIFIGVDGVRGYYEIITNKKGTAGQYFISIVLSTDIPSEEFTIIIVILDNGGLVSEVYDLPVEIVEVGTGKLQISLSWDQLNDVDLHLIEPDGEEIFYLNDFSSDGGVLDLNSNGGCEPDSINIENITYPAEGSDPETGEYIIKVDFWSNCNITEKTNFIVTARLNGHLITGTSIINPCYGLFEANEADYGDWGSGVEVMRFTLSSSQLKSAFVIKYRTIKFPANEHS